MEEGGAAARAGRSGEARRAPGAARAGLEGKTWDGWREFAGSLVVRPDRVGGGPVAPAAGVVDAGIPGADTGEQRAGEGVDGRAERGAGMGARDLVDQPWAFADPVEGRGEQLPSGGGGALGGQGLERPRG